MKFIFSELPFIRKFGETIEDLESIEECLLNENERFYSLTNIPYQDRLKPKIKVLKKVQRRELFYVEFPANYNSGKNFRNIIIYINGLSSHSAWFAPVASKLAKRGIKTYALDIRGSGINCSLFGDRKDWMSDLEEIILKAESEADSVHLASLCFGSRLSNTYVSRNPEGVKSQIMISPGLKTKVNLRVDEKLACFYGGVFNRKNILIKSPVFDVELFSDREDVRKALRQDRLRVVYNRSGDIYNGHLLKKDTKLRKIRTPIMVIYPTKDLIVDYDAVFSILSKTKAKVIYKRYGSNHCLVLEKPEMISKDILYFINELNNR